MDKQSLYFLVTLTRQKKDFNLLFLLYGKPYNISHLEEIMYDNYFTICGGGIIKTEVLEKVMLEKDLQLLNENFISVQNDDEFHKAKDTILSYYEEQKKEEKENDNTMEQNILSTVKEFVENPETQQIILGIVKASKKLTGEKLFSQVDKVYPFVPKRENLIKIFSTVDVNLKNYIIKERKKYGKIID